MAKGAYIGVDGVARKIKQPYIGVDNVARKVTKPYIGVDNVARECFSSVTLLSDLAVGDSVYMNVNGVPTEFLVVHRGIPEWHTTEELYSSNCDGTWLLMKDVYTTMQCREYQYSAYGSNGVSLYLNSTFINLLDAEIQSIINQVTITTTQYGSYGTNKIKVTCKVFLLSYNEVFGYNGTYQDSGVLDYFSGAENADRIAYFNGKAKDWWLRTPSSQTNDYSVGSYGNAGSANGYTMKTFGVRPALIIPNDTLVDSNFNVIA